MLQAVEKIVIKHNTGIVITNKALSGDDGIMFVPVCNSFWLLWEKDFGYEHQSFQFAVVLQNALTKANWSSSHC